MRLIFAASFHTDGDFNFRQERLQQMFYEEKSLYKGTTMKYEYEHESETINVYLDIEGKELPCKWACRDLLEGLICSINTYKYWLVRDLYNLLYYFLDDLFTINNCIKENYLSGNYDNTYLTLKIIGD